MREMVVMCKKRHKDHQERNRSAGRPDQRHFRKGCMLPLYRQDMYRRYFLAAFGCCNQVQQVREGERRRHRKNRSPEELYNNNHRVYILDIRKLALALEESRILGRIRICQERNYVFEASPVGCMKVYRLCRDLQSQDRNLRRPMGQDRIPAAELRRGRGPGEGPAGNQRLNPQAP